MRILDKIFGIHRTADPVLGEILHQETGFWEASYTMPSSAHQLELVIDNTTSLDWKDQMDPAELRTL